MYTSHGHQIPGTLANEGERPPVARCGGVRMCRKCQAEAVAAGVHLLDFGIKKILQSTPEERFPGGEIHDDYQLKARTIVFNFIKANLEKTDNTVFDLSGVYIVWFSKTLKNWKALINTTLPDGMYYEVTYDGEKLQTYLDAYKKWQNVCVKDEDLEPYQDAFKGH